MLGRIAALALFAAEVAAAPARYCPTPDEMGDMVMSVLPDMLDAAAEHCRPALAPDAFLVSERSRPFREQIGTMSRSLRARAIDHYRRLSGETFGSDVADEDIERLLVASFVPDMLDSMTPRRCVAMDSLTEALSPVPPAGLRSTVVALVTLAGREDRGGRCPG